MQWQCSKKPRIDIWCVRSQITSNLKQNNVEEVLSHLLKNSQTKIQKRFGRIKNHPLIAISVASLLTCLNPPNYYLSSYFNLLSISEKIIENLL